MENIQTTEDSTKELLQNVFKVQTPKTHKMYFILLKDMDASLGPSLKEDFQKLADLQLSESSTLIHLLYVFKNIAESEIGLHLLANYSYLPIFPLMEAKLADGLYFDLNHLLKILDLVLYKGQQMLSDDCICKLYEITSRKPLLHETVIITSLILVRQKKFNEYYRKEECRYTKVAFCRSMIVCGFNIDEAFHSVIHELRDSEDIPIRVLMLECLSIFAGRCQKFTVTVKESLLNVIWSFCDDTVENVQFKVKDILEKLLKHFTLPEKSKVISMIIELQWNRKIKYYMLHLVSSSLSMDLITLEFLQGLFSSLEVAELVSHGSYLIIKFFTIFPQKRTLMLDILVQYGTHKSPHAQRAISDTILIQILKKTNSFTEMWDSLKRDRFCGISLLKAAKSQGVICGLDNYKTFINSHMHHENQFTRLDCLLVVTDSPSILVPISQFAIDFLKEFLTVNIRDQDPEFVKKMISILTKYIKKLLAALFSLFRAAHKEKAKELAKNGKIVPLNLDSNVVLILEFIHWLFDFLKKLIHPDSTCTLTCLLLLSNIVAEIHKAGNGSNALDYEIYYQRVCKDFFDIFDSEFILSLQQCCENSFDLVRSTAVDLLCTLPSPWLGFEESHLVSSLLRSLVVKLKSPKRFECDGASGLISAIFSSYVLKHSWKFNFGQEGFGEGLELSATDHFISQLQNILQNQVGFAKFDVMSAACYEPIHGTITALSNVFKMHKESEKWLKIRQMLFDVIDIAFNILDSEAPEGHLPTEFEQEVFLGNSSQVLSSFAWRSLKEASNLLSLISIHHCDSLCLDDTGMLYIKLLTGVLHKGAFSTIYPDFESLCTFLRTRQSTLPSKWMKHVFRVIDRNESSVTRRSAGIPHCIKSIVSSNHHDSLLSDLMAFLLRTVSESKVESQISALNILRVLLSDSNISERISCNVSEIFIICISGFTHSSWAIRNCSMMLFGTLMSKTFGFSKNGDEYLSFNKFFSKYQKLLSFIKNNLTKEGCTYALLTLLSRLCSDSNDSPLVCTQIKEFVLILIELAKSSDYYIRKMTAKALKALLSNSKASLVSDFSLTSRLKSATSYNELHGLLLIGSELQTFEQSVILSFLEYKLPPLVEYCVWRNLDVSKTEIQQFALYKLKAFEKKLNEIVTDVGSMFLLNILIETAFMMKSQHEEIILMAPKLPRFSQILICKLASKNCVSLNACVVEVLVHSTDHDVQSAALSALLVNPIDSLIDYILKLYHCTKSIEIKSKCLIVLSRNNPDYDLLEEASNASQPQQLRMAVCDFLLPLQAHPRVYLLLTRLLVDEDINVRAKATTIAQELLGMHEQCNIRLYDQLYKELHLNVPRSMLVSFFHNVVEDKVTDKSKLFATESDNLYVDKRIEREKIETLFNRLNLE